MSGEAVDSYADAAFGRPHTRCDPTFLIKSFKIITHMKVKKSFVSAIKEYTYTTNLMWMLKNIPDSVKLNLVSKGTFNTSKTLNT